MDSEDTPLLLEAGVRVIPVGAGLANGEAVGESGARLDRGVGDEGHAIHVIRQQQSVPVDGGGDIHVVGHVYDCGIAFGETQDGAGDSAVDRHSFTFFFQRRSPALRRW